MKNKELVKNFELLSKINYFEFKKSFEEKIVNWKWSKGSVYNPKPFYHEINRFAKGKLLKEEPEFFDKVIYKYGFDKDGILVLDCSFHIYQ